MSIRTLGICCAQWSAVAAGHPSTTPVAVLWANRVVSANSAALNEGVAVGSTRREAQSRCPSAVVVEHDETRDARAFEAVMISLEDIAPRWEVTEPGRCAVPSLGPSKYHGGDRKLVAYVYKLVQEALEVALGETATAVGIGIAVADGPRAAAVLAEEVVSTRDLTGSPGVARSPRDSRGVLCVSPGGTKEYLSPLTVRRIASGGAGWGKATDLDDLVGVLRRLGLKNLGRFAALEPTDVLARFGYLGQQAHDFARGAERRPMVLNEVPTDLAVSAVVDPPAVEVDRAAFTAKVLADSLHGELSVHGLACTRVLVVAETELGDRIERLWRDEGALTPAAIAQRVRWQLDGWLSSGRTHSRNIGGVTRIQLIPDQVIPSDGRQLGFWGGSSEEREKALRALARVQAMLGHNAVLLPEWQGGRAPGERYRAVPLDTVDLDSRVGRDDTPWPGSLPSPSPAVVWPNPPVVQVLDSENRRVEVSGRGMISTTPAKVSIDGDGWLEVQRWAGPWCTEERWWDPEAHRRRARIQVMVAGSGSRDAGTGRRDAGTGHLLTLESGQWRLEATYD